jgi:hypothetical protein
MSKRERKNEQFAALCDEIAGGTSKGGQHLRAINRRTQKRKRKQFRSKP